MVIEVTRGRSEVYDILTHLFLYIEADKICNRLYPIICTKPYGNGKIEATATSTKTVGKNELESTMAYLRNYWSVHTTKQRIFTIVFKPQKTLIDSFIDLSHGSRCHKRAQCEQEGDNIGC